MSDINARIRDWRERQERRTSLSPRELDELEDHLRAHIDLEMELNAVLAPTEAFAIARREIGAPVALAKEFAKAGRPRWRRWLATGWGMYAASLLLPVVNLFGTVFYGHDLFRDIYLDVRDEWPLTLVNVAFLMTVPALWGARVSCNRWLRRILGTVGVCTVGMAAFSTWALLIEGGLAELRSVSFLAGVWTWGASYICVANGLRLRAGERAPAEPEKGPA